MLQWSTNLVEGGEYRKRLIASDRGSRFDVRRQEILYAAASLINRHGLRDATLAVIASEIGLNLKSLRYYFKRREDLVAAAFMHSVDLHRELFESVLEIEPFEERIRHLAHGYFQLKARVARGDVPEFVHFGDLRALIDPYRASVGSSYNNLFRLIRKLFRPKEGVWTEEQRSANAHLLISQLLWSVVWIDGYVPEDYPRVADRLADVLLNGMAARPLNFAFSEDLLPSPFEQSERLSQETFLQTATELINDKGYRGASVDQITATLEVTKGAFYHHNETRDGLVISCFERTFGIIRKAQDRAMAGEMNGAAHVCAAAVSLVSRQMLPEGSLLRTSALTAIALDLRQEMARRMSLVTLRFSDMLNDGITDRSVRACDMRIASEAVTAMINSAQELQRWVPSATVENAAELYVRPLLYGFLATSNGSAPT